MESRQSEEDNREVVAPKRLREYRKDKQESQHRFWSRFGVTQSRGSRFEMGTEIPPPIAILLKLYFEGIITDKDLWRVKTRRAPRSVATLKVAPQAQIIG